MFFIPIANHYVNLIFPSVLGVYRIFTVLAMKGFQLKPRDCFVGLRANLKREKKRKMYICKCTSLCNLY